MRLAVFPADFSLEAAEMVVSDAVVEEGDVLDLLTRLVEKSLVTTVISDDTYRYRLLETLREYALARLDERGEVDRWNDRLLEWAMTRVEYVEASLRRPAQDAALQSVRADRRHIAGGDGLGEPPRRPARRVADRLGGTHRPRRRATPDHRCTARATRNPESNRGSRATPTPRSGTSRSSRAIGRHHPNPRRPPSSSSCSRGPTRDAAWATYLGVYGAWGIGDLTKADALVRQAIDGFRSDGDTMGLGYALCRRRDSDDGSRRGPATGCRSRRAPACDRLADGHRPHRRMTRDHRLRPG